MVINHTLLYLGIVATVLSAIASFLIPILIGWIIALLITPEAKEVYQKITNPYKRVNFNPHAEDVFARVESKARIAYLVLILVAQEFTYFNQMKTL